MSNHPHPYADRQTFERLMLLIATLVPRRGLSRTDSPQSGSTRHHNALQSPNPLRKSPVPGDLTMPHRRKDLETLRRYGILDRQMYRWGYYLGTGALRRDELQVAFNALASQAKYQGDPQARQIHRSD